MKNVTTRYFCRKHHAYSDGRNFALKFERMRECYDALLSGEAGAISADWACWVATREGVLTDQALRLFAVKCARSVQCLMQDQRSIDALDVAERYAAGRATGNELDDARVSARAANGYLFRMHRYDRCANFAATLAACAIGVNPQSAAQLTAMSLLWEFQLLLNSGCWREKKSADDLILGLLREIGNPFEGEKK